jgi:hypothetical protein
LAAQNKGIDLSWCLGKLVKVIFREDAGMPIEVRKGILTGFDDNFIQLETHKNIHVINRNHIISIKVFDAVNSGWDR